MRILFLTHAFNSLTQRLFIELGQLGHEVSVEFDIHDAISEQAVALYAPDLIIAPFLKRAIPKSIWGSRVCLVVHPGIPGDRGPAALDWAILHRQTRWGVTVLQAEEEMDAGPVWAAVEFAMRETTKASLYRNEVTEAAVVAVCRAVNHIATGKFTPETLDYSNPKVRGRLQPSLRQSDRAIGWQHDDSATVLRKIRSADGFPGLRDQLFGRRFYLFDAHAESVLHGDPGAVIARSGSAICRATVDGAIWIGHLREPEGEFPFKLPAVHLLGDALEGLPEIAADGLTGYRDLWYEREGEVGFLYFPFYNGAMGSGQCQRLRETYIEACRQDTRVIVLMGGPDYWSNGLHLNLIEAAASAADESWENINAIDDLAREIINTDNQLTVAALQGNAGAGGVFLARAADEVWARQGVILNPHYKDMGNLYGSEYWTYLLPRYAGEENAKRVTRARLPMGAREAAALGLVNKVFRQSPEHFVSAVKSRAADLAAVPAYASRLEYKNKRRQVDERSKPLQAYRLDELERLRSNFYGFDPSYHIARYNFVHKIPKSRTPVTIARHRRTAETLRRVS